MLQSKGKARFSGLRADSFTATCFPITLGILLLLCSGFGQLRCFPSTGLALPPSTMVPAVQKRLLLLGKHLMVSHDPLHRHSVIDTARAQLCPETTSCWGQRGHSAGTETQHAGDRTQVVGWTQHPTLEAKGIPWTSQVLVLCFPWPQSAATPLGTSNLPPRHN